LPFSSTGAQELPELYRGSPPARGSPRLEGGLPELARAAAPPAGTDARPRRLGSFLRVNDTYGYPASAVVKILWQPEPSYVAMCSGALISPFHVLTAGHCVWDADGSPAGFYDVASYYIIPGQTDVQAPYADSGWGTSGTDKPFGIARVVNSQVWGYNSNPSFEYDYALLTLDRSLDWTGSLGFASSIAPGSAVALAGYPGGDYSGIFMYNRTGYRFTEFPISRVTGLPISREMLMDALICGGDSGSSVVDRGGIVRGVAVGVYYDEALPSPPECGDTSSAKRLDSTAYNNLATALRNAIAPASYPAVYELVNPRWGPAADAMKGSSAPQYVQGTDCCIPFFVSLMNYGRVAAGALSVTLYRTSALELGSSGYSWLGSWATQDGIAGAAFRVVNFTTSSLPPLGDWWLVAYFEYAGAHYSEDASARTIVVGQVAVVSPTASPTRSGSAAPSATRSASVTATGTGSPSAPASRSTSPSVTASASATRRTDRATATPHATRATATPCAARLVVAAVNLPRAAAVALRADGEALP